jgi:hypothetical protein
MNFMQKWCAICVFLGSYSLTKAKNPVSDSLIFNYSGKSHSYLIIPVEGKGFFLLNNNEGGEWVITLYDTLLNRLNTAKTGISSKETLINYDQYDSSTNILFGELATIRKKARADKADIMMPATMQLLRLNSKGEYWKTEFKLPKRIAYSGFESLEGYSLITGNLPAKLFPAILQSVCAIPSFGLTYAFGLRLTTHTSYAYVVHHATGNITLVPVGAKGHNYIYSTDKDTANKSFIINHINKRKRNRYTSSCMTVSEEGEVKQEWKRKSGKKGKVEKLAFHTSTFPRQDTSYRIGLYAADFSDYRPYYNLQFIREYEAGGFYIQPLVNEARQKAKFISFKKLTNKLIKNLEKEETMSTLFGGRSDVRTEGVWPLERTYFTNMNGPFFMIENIHITKDRDYIVSGQICYPEYMEINTTDSRGKHRVEFVFNRWSVKKGFLLTLDPEMNQVHDTVYVTRRQYLFDKEIVVRSSVSHDSSSVQVAYTGETGQPQIISYSRNRMEIVPHSAPLIPEGYNVSRLASSSFLLYRTTGEKDDRKFILRIISY